MSSHEHLERGPWKGEKWWVTHFNYVDEAVSQFSFPSRIVVHDVTLRDGEQTPGVVLRTEEKVEIARALDEAGVDRIEAGMPVVSEEDMEAIRKIARLGLSAKVFGFGRIRTEDIDACLKADVDGVITEGPVGYPKLRYQFGWSPDQLFESAVKAIDYAKDHGLVTIFFTVDGTRADLGFLTDLLQQLERETKVDGFTVADTYGSLTPEGARFLFRHLRSKLMRPLEFHGHNDFGLATARGGGALVAPSLRPEDGHQAREAVRALEARRAADRFQGGSQQGRRRGEGLHSRVRDRRRGVAEVPAGERGLQP
jgi:methanogen homocitrate synthase